MHSLEDWVISKGQIMMELQFDKVKCPYWLIGSCNCCSCDILEGSMIYVAHLPDYGLFQVCESCGDIMEIKTLIRGAGVENDC